MKVELKQTTMSVSDEHGALDSMQLSIQSLQDQQRKRAWDWQVCIKRKEVLQDRLACAQQSFDIAKNKELEAQRLHEEVSETLTALQQTYLNTIWTTPLLKTTDEAG
jgi:hypothetical protein